MATRWCPTCRTAVDGERSTCPNCLAYLLDPSTKPDATVRCHQCDLDWPARMQSCPNCLAELASDLDRVSRAMSELLGSGRRLPRSAGRPAFRAGPGCTVLRPAPRSRLIVAGADELMEATVPSPGNRAAPPLACLDLDGSLLFTLSTYAAAERALVAHGADGAPLATFVGGRELDLGFDVRDETSAPVGRVRPDPGLGSVWTLVETGGGGLATLRATDVRATDVRATDVRATDVRATDVRATDVRATDVRATDVRATDVRATDVRATDVRATDVEHGDHIDDEWRLVPIASELPLMTLAAVAMVLAAKVVLGRPEPVAARPDRGGNPPRLSGTYRLTPGSGRLEGSLRLAGELRATHWSRCTSPVAKGGSVGFLVQSNHGVAGNFEFVLPRGVGGGVWHWWRDNDDPALPWYGPSTPFGCPGEVATTSLIEGSLPGSANLEVVASVGAHLCHSAREAATGQWLAPVELPGTVAPGSAPAFVQSRFGPAGNFEVVAPLAGGGLGHWWRDNSASSFPWHGPMPFAGDHAQGAAMVHGLHSANLEVVARFGDRLQHWWRDPGGIWNRSDDVGGGVGGQHDLCQTSYPAGSPPHYQLVAPLAGGGMGHWWADPTAPALTWAGPTPFGSGQVRSVGVIQSRSVHLEVVAVFDDHLEHWWREAAHPFTWHGPAVFWDLATQDAATHGRCDVLYHTGTVAIHAALLRTGKVLVWSFHDHEAAESQSHLIDLATATTQQLPNVPHAFCSGLAAAPDGAIVVTGGHQGDVGHVHLFDPDHGAWSQVAQMSAGRWYPTQTCLPDGRVSTMSGSTLAGPLNPNNPANNTIEIFDRATGLSAPTPFPSPWSAAFPPSIPTIDLYPFVFVLPEGDLFVHARHVTRRYDWRADQWGPEMTGASDISRTYPGQGTAVLLCLEPPDYVPRALVMGGGGANPEDLNEHTPAVATAEVIDLSQPNPAWQFTQPMAHARVMPDAVLLPDASVVVVGGSASGRADAGAEPVYPVERFDPATGQWTTMCDIAVPRLYHSTALLLPDARVLMMGKDGIFQPGPFQYPEHRGEVFSPPYLFAGPRPSITAAPTSATYGQALTVSTPAPAKVDAARMVRPGSVTHSFNHDQRAVGLVITGRSTGALTVEAPPSPNLAPPGWYLLFLLAKGVPSVGHFIKLSA